VTYIIDIETTPHPDTLALMKDPPEEFLMKGVAKNWKDSTIDDHREKQRVKWPEEIKKLASLDWRYGMICAVGLFHNDRVYIGVIGMDDLAAQKLKDMVWEKHMEVVDASGVDTEEDLLRWMCDEKPEPFKGERVAGFNLRNFDLPWIRGRCMVNGVPFRLHSGSRYDPTKVTDWSDILCNYGSFDMKGWNLARYAKLFGLQYQPEGEGKDVFAMMAAKDYAGVGYHCAMDVLTTWALDEKGKDQYVGQTE